MTEVRMSLAEGAAALGLPVNTLRSRYKAGKIRGERDNAGRLFVWVDPSKQTSKKATSKNSKRLLNEGELEALKAHVETLKVQLDRAEARAMEWQGKAEAAQAEVLELWQKLAEDQPRSWWHRILGRSS